MPKTILEYQRAFTKVIEELKNKKSVVAILVFGSIINGDIWEKSDIDMMVISSEEQKELRNIYSYYSDIPIHIKLMSKTELIRLCSGNNKGEHIHRLFSSSKLIYSIDKDIDKLYDEERFYSDFHREKWNVSFLSKLLKNISECKKYIYMESIYNAYTLCNIVLRDYSKLIVNSSGYIINRDIVTMALSVDENLAKEVEKFFKDKNDLSSTIERFINFIEERINLDIKLYASIVIQYIQQKECDLSSNEIREGLYLKDYNINMEEILTKLYELKIINKRRRGYEDLNGEILIHENVYYI